MDTLSSDGLRVLSLCGGVETGLLSLIKLGIPIAEYHTYEILPEAIAVSSHHFPFVVHHGNLIGEDFSKYKGFDLILAGTCCFTGDEIVLTKNGYKKISEIEIGDYVLTHKNRYRKVINKFNNGIKPTVNLYTMQSSKIECTTDHKIYTRRMIKEYNRETKHEMRRFLKPEWTQVKDLNRNYYVGTPVNQREEIPYYNGIDIKQNKYKIVRKNELKEKIKTQSFWKLVGRFIGDGWITEYNSKRANGKLRKVKRVIICCSHKEKNELKEIIENAGFHCSVSKHRTTYEFQISNYELACFLLRFGKGASNKHLTNDVLNLPCELLKSFIDGYMSADGCYLNNKDMFQFTTTSKQLAYDISMCWNKVYKIHTSITLNERPKKYKIENRIVNQKNNYVVRCPLKKHKQDKAFYEDGYIWSPFRRVEDCNQFHNVYDIEVEEDHSYIVNNIIVHNCQSISRLRTNDPNVAQGLKGKSGIFFEAVRAVKEVQPRWFMFENVIPNSDEDLKTMNECLGVEAQLIDSALFSVQSRERYYWTNFKIPEINIRNNMVFADIMQKDVGEKYFVNKPFDPINLDKRVCTMIQENNLEMCRRVYNPKFKMCTLTCISGGGQQKKVLDNGRPRKLTEIEYERCQGMPDDYTNVKVNGRPLSYSKRCSLMGNGWNEPTIRHILSGIKEEISR